MSSIAKTNISLSKKDLTKSRIPPVASRNVVFYHKTTGGELSIDLNALSMPSEMPTAVQATAAEISGAQLYTNKKNLDLTSSTKGQLIQHLDYVVTSGYTIQLIGPYLVSGAEIDEIFTGTINSAPISDLVVASARSVDKTYELGIGLTTLNLGREYQVGVNPNDDIGSIKVFVNGVLAHRDIDYAEVDAGSGYGTTIEFFSAPVSLPYQIAVDFGVMSITDNDGIGAIESLSGAIKKIADDLAVVAGTSAEDYLTANPSEIERRTFGDMVLDHSAQLLKYDTTQNLSVYTKTKWQKRFLLSNITVNTPDITDLKFSNLTIGKTYRVTCQASVISGAQNGRVTAYNGATILAQTQNQTDGTGPSDRFVQTFTTIFTASSVAVTFDFAENTVNTLEGDGTAWTSWSMLEELPNHEVTTQWT